MRIDDFDHTLVCDEEDLQTVLGYFKEYRVLPDYIERSILRIVLRQLYKGLDDFKTTDDYFRFIPDYYIQGIIKDLNSMYFSQSKVEYSNRYLAYLLYYLPANIFKVWKPLLDLQLKNILKSHMRILDVGTGPGSIPIGIIEYYRLLAESFPEILFSLNFTLIEAEEEFLKIAEEMINSVKVTAPANLDISIENLLCEKVDANSKYNNLKKFDLITMSNFLNVNEGENYRKAMPIITTFKDILEDDGSLIIIEPGDKISSKSLKRIRNEVVNNGVLNVFSPCIGIWENKNKYDCQCFSMVRCFWKLPRIYEYLVSKGLSKAKRINIPFNYVVLRKDKTKKYEINRNPQYYVKLADLKQHCGETVNVMAIIRTVIQKGNIINIALCDGSCGFSEDSKAIWVNISEEQLHYFGINIPLIAAEKITLKKVIVKQTDEKINLEIKKNTRIIIDY